MTYHNMPADPGDEIRRIKTEYENSQNKEGDEEINLPDDSLIGSIWLNPETNDMFICNGKINGKATWSRVNDKQMKNMWI